MALKLFVILASLALVYGVSIPSELKLTDQLFQGNIRIGQSLTGSQLNLKNALLDQSTVDRLFEEFKQLYNKHYFGIEEESRRKEIFSRRIQMVANNNLKAIEGQSKYVLNIFSLSDLTVEEMLQSPVGVWPNSTKEVTELKDSEYANSWVFDKYRQEHHVGPIQNQGSCGSCVYFAAAATIESYWSIKGHNMVTLSTQQLNDCARDEKRGNRGCRHGGGTFVPTFDYIKKHGLTSMHNYPYIANDANCEHNKENQRVAHINDWHPVTPHNDENALRNAVEHHGPVAVAVNFNDELSHYRSGIYHANTCPLQGMHAVVVVGYGWDAPANMNYWILKNSWGEGYGEHGFFKIQRDHGNLCGIARDAVYVV